MKFPFLVLTAVTLSLAPTAQASQMLNKQITEAMVKKDGKEAVTLEDVKQLAESLRKSYGLQVSYIERGNKDVNALKDVDLLAVRSVGKSGTTYSKRQAADPVQVAYLQLRQIEKSMSELSPRERTLLRHREVDIRLFADASIRDHRVFQHRNEIAIVNAARAQPCQKVSDERHDFWDNSDRDLLEGANIGAKHITCAAGSVKRFAKDLGTLVTGIESDHKVGFLHSRGYVTNEIRLRILGTSAERHDDDDRRHGRRFENAPGSDAVSGSAAGAEATSVVEDAK